MSRILVNNHVYSIHPTYDLYGADENGNIIHIVKKVPMKGNKKKNGYLRCSVRTHAQKVYKTYQVHRFVWECHNGLILDDGKVIDHVNDDKEDNRLCNLQLLTQQENCKKSAKERDYSFVGKNHENKKRVKATNCQTKTIRYFKSMYACQERLGINVGIIKMACEGKNNCKSGLSKKDLCRYVFEYDVELCE